MNKLFLASLAVASFIACDGGDKTCDSGEVCDSLGTDSGSDCSNLATALGDITYDCDSVGYFYDVNYIGWGSSPEMYIYESASSNPWNEVHPFPADPFEFDPNGCSELYYLELTSVATIGEVVEGSTTLFSCDMIDTLTWLVYAYDTSGNAVECVGFGDDVAATNSFFGASCPEI
jgi:hypothetical protein